MKNLLCFISQKFANLRNTEKHIRILKVIKKPKQNFNPLSFGFSLQENLKDFPLKFLAVFAKRKAKVPFSNENSQKEALTFGFKKNQLKTHAKDKKF